MKFEVITNSDPKGTILLFKKLLSCTGRPCIKGSKSTDGEFGCVVFSKSGGIAVNYPLAEKDSCMFEVSVGDFIRVLKNIDGTLYIDSYCIADIDEDVVAAVHALL